MIGDFVTVPGTQVDIPECHVPCEHLVEMSTLSMSLSTRLHCSSETERPQLLDDVSHVVVEVTTNDYRSIGVLLDDVPYHFCHSYRSLLQVLLLSRLEITVQNLDIVFTQLQLGPAEIGPECLHQLQPGVPGVPKLR